MSDGKHPTIIDSLVLLHKVQSQVIDLSKTVFGVQILYIEFFEHMLKQKIEDWPLFYILMRCRFTHDEPAHMVVFNDYLTKFTEAGGMYKFDFARLERHVTAWRELLKIG